MSGLMSTNTHTLIDAHTNGPNSESFLGPCRQKIVKKYGVIECDPLVLMGLDKTVS